jgi:mannitol operon transcriptional antiterminator
MNRQPNINSRQKELLRLLLSNDAPITLQALASSLKISVRTVQRELNFLDSILLHYQLFTVKRFGFGIQVSGSNQDRFQLQQDLSGVYSFPGDFTVDERLQGLIRDLLLYREPLKGFVFSRKYGVTESTISHDLNRAEEWLANFAIRLIRKPGLGTYIEGTEQQIRKAASHLLYQDMTVEEWLQLFALSQNQNEEHILGMSNNRLEDLVDIPNVLAVEKVVRELIQTEIRLTDREYVNLIVHLALSMERIKKGEFISGGETDDVSLKGIKEYSLAKRLVQLLEQHFNITVPAKDLSYISIHLQGTHLRPKNSIDRDDEELHLIYLMRSFLRNVERHLHLKLADDEILLKGLSNHLASTIRSLNLPIINPMMDQIHENYAEIFAACQKAAELLSIKVGQPIPDAEVGYLTMHIAGALLRKQDVDKSKYKAIVVCASGFGTSNYLTSRLKKEIPNIEVQAMVSAIGLQEWLKNHEPIDFTISTISLPSFDSQHTVVVSPFLQDNDLKAIRNMMERVLLESEMNENRCESSGIVRVARYGEAMLELIRNFTLIEKQSIADISLATLLEGIRASTAICDFNCLVRDLEAREEMGGFVIDELAVLHAKTAGVKELFAAVIRIKQPVLWKDFYGKMRTVSSFIILAAPLNATEDHLAMISEISAALIEESFVKLVCEASIDSLMQEMEHIISSGYLEKADEILKVKE